MKPSLLFITGWAHPASTFDPVAAPFSDTFDTQILSGADVLEARSIPPVDYIITGSMGGLLAIEFLPETCKKLILLSSTAKFCADKEGYRCGTPERIMDRMIRQFKEHPTEVLEAFFKNVHAPHKGKPIPPIHFTQEQLVDGLEYLKQSDLREKVPSIDIPVLLLHGADDQIIPLAAAEWLDTTFPNSRLTVYPGEGHALPAYQFERVVAEMKSFLLPD